MLARDELWVSRREAAQIIGCPVTTVDWFARTGCIESRRRQGRRPSLLRSSVEAFAAQWRERPRDSLGRHLPVKPSPAPPEPTGWLTAEETTAVLGLSRDQVVRMGRQGQLAATRHDGRWWFRVHAVQAEARERRAWISYAEAARVASCSDQTIARAVASGVVEQRRVHRSKPSLSRVSVLEFAQTRQRRREEARAAAAARAAARWAGPPADGEVWLDVTTTALVLGISEARVKQLAAVERLPVTRCGRRLWFRRAHVEQVAAARTLRLLTQARARKMTGRRPPSLDEVVPATTAT